MMIVWLLWEFAESARDLRSLLRALLAGSWVLALLTVVDFRSVDAIAAGQFRFAAYGQDPNDVARFLDLGFPAAALLANSGGSKLERFLFFGYLPLGLLAVILTASRGGFVAAGVALAGCVVLLAHGHARAVIGCIFALPASAVALWLAIPREIFARLATIPEELSSGNLNQRLNIWSAGWRAFMHAPFLGSGGGTFVSAAHLAPIDTAHNTALSIMVSGGLIALSIALAIFVSTVRAALSTQGSLRLALVVSLMVWVVASLVGTVEENRTTWMLFGMIAVAGRLAGESPEALNECFPEPKWSHENPGFDTASAPEIG
jgi:O-antigen ligase